MGQFAKIPGMKPLRSTGWPECICRLICGNAIYNIALNQVVKTGRPGAYSVK